MTKTAQWLTTYLDPDKQILHKPVKARNKAGREFDANLHIESTNSQRQIQVSANYNSSPHAGTVSLAKGYLTQAEIEDFDKNPSCVLEAVESN